MLSLDFDDTDKDEGDIEEEIEDDDGDDDDDEGDDGGGGGGGDSIDSDFFKRSVNFFCLSSNCLK